MTDGEIGVDRGAILVGGQTPAFYGFFRLRDEPRPVRIVDEFRRTHIAVHLRRRYVAATAKRSKYMTAASIGWRTSFFHFPFSTKTPTKR